MTDFMVCSELGLKHYKAGEITSKANLREREKSDISNFFKNFIFLEFLNKISNKIAKKHQIRININLQ